MQQCSIIAIVALVSVLAIVQATEQIRQCSCDEQQQQMNAMEMMYTECQNDCQNKCQPEMQKMVMKQDEQNMKDCFNQHTHAMHEMMKCTNQKMVQKNSCTKDKNGPQMMKENNSRMFAMKFKQMTDRMEEQNEKTMAKAGGQQQNMFAQVYTKKMTGCMNQCFYDKAQQMDSAKQFNCEFKLDGEQMKQTMMEECFNGEQYKQTVEDMCRCSQKQNAQGAQEFCQRFDEDKQQIQKDFFMKNMQ